MNLHITLTPSPSELAQRFRRVAEMQPLYQRIAEAIKEPLEFALKEEAPESGQGAMASGEQGPAGKSLKESITGSVETSGDGVSLVFYDDVPYIRYVLEGTAPHLIRPRNGSVLVFYGASGELVFAREVHHPGTAANPFPARAWERARDEVTTIAAETTREWLKEAMQ